MCFAPARAIKPRRSGCAGAAKPVERVQAQRARRVEALIEFLGELIRREEPTRGEARRLLARVYAGRCLEPITGSSTGSAFERELAVAYALAERGLGWSEELEKLSRAFRVERACSMALSSILAGADPLQALEKAGARPTRAWVAALLGYARALHYLGYLGDSELAELFGALERSGVGAEALRLSRKLAVAHKLAQLIASGLVADRGSKEARKRSLALLFGGGAGDRPSDALVWRVAVNVYGVGEREALKLLKVDRASLLRSAASSASLWYCWVASQRELEEAEFKLDPLWQEARRVAAGRVSGFLPAAAAPVALALLEQAAEGLDPDGFLAKLDKLLGAGGDPVELLLSWDARGWRLSTLLLATRAFEVRLERGYEMLVADRVAAGDALELGVRGLAERLLAKVKEALQAAKLREGVAERWLKLASLLLALDIVGRACELAPPPKRGKPAALLAERAEVGGVEVAVEVLRRGWRKYLAASVSGKRVVTVRLGDPRKAEGKLLKALDSNLPKSAKPEVKAELQRLLRKVLEQAAKNERLSGSQQNRAELGAPESA